MNKKLDRAGIVLSLLCIAHCIFLPLLLLLAPFYWLEWIGAELVHWLLLILALPVAATALVAGFRHHGQLSVAILGAWGAVMLVLGVVLGHDYPSWEMPITVTGATALVIAHLGNTLMSRRQNHKELRAGQC